MGCYWEMPSGKAKHVDPENDLFIVETSLPTPMTGRVDLLIYWRVPGLYMTYSNNNGQSKKLTYSLNCPP